jgi:hypothetical protein
LAAFSAANPGVPSTRSDVATCAQRPAASEPASPSYLLSAMALFGETNRAQPLVACCVALILAVGRVEAQTCTTRGNLVECAGVCTTSRPQCMSSKLQLIRITQCSASNAIQALFPESRAICGACRDGYTGVNTSCVTSKWEFQIGSRVHLAAMHATARWEAEMVGFCSTRILVAIPPQNARRDVDNAPRTKLAPSATEIMPSTGASACKSVQRACTRMSPQTHARV